MCWMVLNQSQSKHYPSLPAPANDSCSTSQVTTQVSSSSLQNHEKEYLESIKALSLPKSPQLETFLKTFFSQVAPRTPVLSFMSFSTSAIGSLIQSPLLVQSMLFASARFLSLDIIHDLGYKNREDARNGIYRKAKSLEILTTSSIN